MRYYKVTRTYLVQLPDADDTDAGVRNRVREVMLAPTGTDEASTIFTDTGLAEALTWCADIGEFELPPGGHPFMWGACQQSSQVEETTDASWAVF